MRKEMKKKGVRKRWRRKYRSGRKMKSGRESGRVRECDWPAPLTDSQSAAGAHGAARLRPVLGDRGDADGAAEAGAALLDTDVLV